MPTLGFSLGGHASDVAALQRLASTAPELVVRPWQVVRTTAATWLCCEGLDAAAAEVGVALEPVGPGEVREARHLLEALPPRALPGEPPADIACFVVDADAPEAGQLLERLLLLDRGDTRITELSGRLVAVVSAPPLYLLMRARDTDHAVRAYVGGGPLWVRWCHAHPLAELAAERLADAKHSALVDPDGRWHLLPGEWGLRPVHDALRADFPAPREVWTAADTTTRFTVRLRLEAAPATDPELWLLSADELLRLEALVDHAPTEALNRLTLARLEAPGGRAAYVLRERVVGGRAGLGVRVSEIVGRDGYVRAPGSDGLFVPVGRRLAPRMRPADLREVLGLDKAPVVVVREGPEVVHVGAAPESPLSAWVDYVATDQRLVLDQLLEDMVFASASVEVEAPTPAAKVRARGPRPQKAKRKRKGWVARARDALNTAAVPEEVRALQVRAAALQETVVAGACDDAGVWRELGEVLAALGETDDAASCLEAAVFHGADAADALLEARGGRQEVEALLDQATADRPGDAPHVGARVLADLAAGTPLLDGLAARVLQLFGERTLPVSRRLAWAVPRALHGRTADRIGLTRAREALVGALNTEGMRENLDAPRFVRYALAGGETEQTQAQADQATALRQMWAQHEALLTEGEAQGLLHRAVFTVGFFRVGDEAMWRPLGELVTEELPYHDPPVQALARMYLARVGDAEVELKGLADRDARAVAFYRKRSRWLRGAEEAAEATIDPRWVRQLDRAGTKGLAKVVNAAMQDRQTFDAHIAGLVERAVHIALDTGNDDVIAAVHSAVVGGWRSVSLLAPRARVVGAALRAAAFLEDERSVNGLVNAVVDLAPKLDAVGQLLRAVEPALAALRRVGSGQVAERFLAALAGVAEKDHPEAPKVAAFVAEGLWMLDEPQRASVALEGALGAALSDRLRYVPRFEAAAAALQTVRAWPAEMRVPVCERVLASVAHFGDAFTARRWYRTHQALLVEAVVGAVSDARTFASARLRTWLEAEEQVVRRRILADWRAS